MTTKSAPADRRLPILGFSVADGRGGDGQLGDISVLKTPGIWVGISFLHLGLKPNIKTMKEQNVYT